MEVLDFNEYLYIYLYIMSSCKEPFCNATGAIFFPQQLFVKGLLIVLEYCVFEDALSQEHWLLQTRYPASKSDSPAPLKLLLLQIFQLDECQIRFFILGCIHVDLIYFLSYHFWIWHISLALELNSIALPNLNYDL